MIGSIREPTQPGKFAEIAVYNIKFSDTLLPTERHGRAEPDQVTIIKFSSKQIPLHFTQ